MICPACAKQQHTLCLAPGTCTCQHVRAPLHEILKDAHERWPFLYPPSDSRHEHQHDRTIGTCLGPECNHNIGLEPYDVA